MIHSSETAMTKVVIIHEMLTKEQNSMKSRTEKQLFGLQDILLMDIQTESAVARLKSYIAQHSEGITTFGFKIISQALKMNIGTEELPWTRTSKESKFGND